MLKKPNQYEVHSGQLLKPRTQTDAMGLLSSQPEQMRFLAILDLNGLAANAGAVRGRAPSCFTWPTRRGLFMADAAGRYNHPVAGCGSRWAVLA
jgi:hypothetical protein